MDKLIIANWKMNPGTKAEGERLFRESQIQMPGVEVVIAPPFVFLGRGAKGAQNVHFAKKGAFTGEVSASMLKSVGVEYVILGHSERKEKDEVVNKKVKICLKEGLTPVLLFKTKKDLLDRLVGVKGVSKLILCYEPPNSISSNSNSKPTDPDDALSMGILARRVLSQKYSKKIASNARILYGGSVNAKNADSYELDGLLVGGASLKPEIFKKIIKNVSKRFSNKEQESFVKGRSKRR
jgi:triosephosphate isomerase